MDWESLYCPNRGCRYYGRPFLQGHLVKNGSSHGQKQARCKACETPVSIRYGTAYLDLHADPAAIRTVWIGAEMAGGVDVAASPRVMTRRGGGEEGACGRGALLCSQASQCGLVVRPAKGVGS